MKQFDRKVAKTRTRDRLTAFNKLTRIVDGQPRIVAQARTAVMRVER